MGTQLGIEFEHFNYWRILYGTYTWHKKPINWDLKVFEYLATKREEDDEHFNNFGKMFFRTIALFAAINTNNLTWEDVTKNIKFKPVQNKEEIEYFLHNIKRTRPSTRKRYKPLLENDKVLADILRTMCG